jgi:hypothetical protein
MENPWRNFDRKSKSMILSVDREAIEHYNSEKRSKATRVVKGSIPSPFIGSPSSARLVLLNLNPGHRGSDLEDQKKPNFRKAIVLTLKHELKDYPFYPLNPKFRHTEAGKWWTKKLDRLREASELNDAILSRMIMVIEWFPYHSTKCGLPEKPICKSQEYSFYLAKKMFHKPGVITVGMRAMKRWRSADPEFEKVRFLRSNQNPCISRGNMDGRLFDRIIKRLRQ